MRRCKRQSPDVINMGRRALRHTRRIMRAVERGTPQRFCRNGLHHLSNVRQSLSTAIQDGWLRVRDKFHLTFQRFLPVARLI